MDELRNPKLRLVTASTHQKKSWFLLDQVHNYKYLATVILAQKPLQKGHMDIIKAGLN
jgi:hypothetical protein